MSGPDRTFEPDPEKKPWWNDEDKIGGIFATAVLLLILAIVVSLVIFGIIKFYQHFL